MKRKAFLLAAALTLTLPFHAAAQLRDEVRPVEQEDTLRLTLEQALQIALSENVAVKVADKEIERAEYAKKGTYASLFPQVNGSAAFQRTIKKQVMYMDFDMSSMGFGGGEGAASGEGEESSAPAAAAARGGSSGGGIEVGRWNTWNAGVSATMPLVNAQLWKSLAISGEQVELAVEQARSSRLDMVTQVKQAFYAVLLAKEALRVYEEVWENAVKSFEQTRRRYNVQKASELEFTRAQATVANAIPNLYNAENSVALSLWQLKAVMGVDLDAAIDVAGSLEDFAEGLSYDEALADEVDLSQYDYVVDCIDTVSAKMELVRRCTRLGVPIICSMGAAPRREGAAGGTELPAGRYGAPPADCHPPVPDDHGNLPAEPGGSA